VRAAFAYFCPGFVDCFGEHWSTVFIDNLESLMRDPEVHVRRLAVDSMPKIAENWLPENAEMAADGSTSPRSAAPDFATISRSKERILDSLLPGFMRLVSDSSHEVRTSVAAATGRLLRILARLKDEAYDESLDTKVVQVMTPLMQRILHDDCPAEVSVALLEGMRMDDRILRGQWARHPSMLLVASQVDLLLPAIALLATHKRWRLRKAVVECLPTIQILVPPGASCDTSLRELWALLLADSVDSVRRTAGELLCLSGRLLELMGGARVDWVQARVLPRCLECLEAANFKQRQLGLHMLHTIIKYGCLRDELVESDLVPLLISAADDRLANVRICVAVVLDDVGMRLPLEVRQKLLKDRVALLIHDPDRDVRFFARKAASHFGIEQSAPPPPAPSPPAPPPPQPPAPEVEPASTPSEDPAQPEAGSHYPEPGNAQDQGDRLAVDSQGIS
jgi:hypothetical protein